MSFFVSKPKNKNKMILLFKKNNKKTAAYIQVVFFHERLHKICGSQQVLISRD